MVPQNITNEEYISGKTISTGFRTSGIRGCIRSLHKARGTPLVEQILLLIVMRFGLATNVWRLFDSKRAQDYSTSKTALYNLMNTDYNWRTVIQNYAKKVSTRLSKTQKKSVRYLIVDDTTIKRCCSKCVELLSWCYDHTSNTFYRGFHDLCLGWSDGMSYLPIDHVLLANSKKDKQICGIKGEKLDRRTTGAKRRLEAQRRKPDLVIEMVERALRKGFIADYLLMDSWFCYHSHIKNLLNKGIHVICMLKDMKCNKYFIGDNNNKGYTLKQIIKLYANPKKRKTCGSVILRGKQDLLLKLVFVKKANCKNILTIASTDINLSEEEICQHYATRWGCECFFKDAKQFLNLEKGCQARSFDSVYAHISITMIAYICLQWINRTTANGKTKGRQYHDICEEVRSLSFIQAIDYIFKSSFIGLENILDKHIPSVKIKKAILDEFITNMSETISNISYFIRSFLENISLKGLREVVQSGKKSIHVFKEHQSRLGLRV